MPHTETRTLHEIITYPDHDPRTESEKFHANKKHLEHNLGLGCWICGIKESLECHHIFEWATLGFLDLAIVQNTLKQFDPYGFSAKDDSPIEDLDDIKNLLILCESHHRAKYTGVHEISYPIWLAQRAMHPGDSITPPIEKGG